MSASEFVAGLVDEVVARVLAELAAPPAEPAPSGVRLLTADEVAERLGRSSRWVRERRRRGDLPYVRLDGGAAMYRPEDVEALVRARVVGR